MRKLNIWWDGRLVGQLTKNRHGELGFGYSADWLGREDAPALSDSLPKREAPFSRRECRPFFGDPLPEESQRDTVAHALGVSLSNDFALLDRLGGDVAGALQLLSPGEVPKEFATNPQPIALDEAGLMRVLDALHVRPFRTVLIQARSKLGACRWL